jgi:hypothetical protein
MDTERHKTGSGIVMKALLREMVDWIEACHLQRAPCGSPFEDQVEPALLIKTELALDSARASDWPVELFTTKIDPKALLAGLVLRRSQVGIEKVFRGDLDDDAFERLTQCVFEISHSQLRLVEGWPPASKLPMAFFGGPVYALFAM